METKQALLNSLLEKIRVLQNGYDTISSLPDEIFEQATNIAANGFAPSTSKQADTDSENDNQEYGYIRKAIISILERENKPLTKNQIVDAFVLKYPNLDGERTVRYALNGLKNKGEVKGYKPLHKRIQGYLWTLSEWWNENDLKDEYKYKK